MKELFNNILSVQFGASIAIVILLLSRTIMKKHYVAKLRYWLWLVLALRLLLPFDFNYHFDNKPAINIAVQDYYITTQQTEAEQPATIEIVDYTELQAQIDSFDQHTTTSTSQVIKTVSIFDLAFYTWFVIVFCLLVTSFLSYFIEKKSILQTAEMDENSTALLNSVKSEFGIKYGIEVVVCQYIGSPMLIGVLKPVIVLPDIEYTNTQLEMILRHEITHFLRRDILYKLVLHIVSCVYWFNPLVAVMVKVASKDIEISCDEDVVKNHNKDFKAQYAQTIINVITMKDRKLILATNFSPSAKLLKERFSTILFSKKLKNGKAVIALFLALVLMVSTLVGCTATEEKGKYDTILNNGGGRFDSETSVEIVEKPDITNNIKVSHVNTELSRLVHDNGDDSYEGVFSSLQPFDKNNIVFRVNQRPETKYGMHFTAVLSESGQPQILCNKANCTHTTESCNAFVDMSGDYFSVDGKIYYFNPNGYSMSNGERSRIELYKVSESGMEQLTILEDYVQNYDKKETVVAYGNDIYLSATSKKELKSSVILKIDLETGELVDKIYPADSKASSRVLSITENGKQMLYLLSNNINTGTDDELWVYDFETKSHSLLNVLENARQNGRVSFTDSKDYYIYGDYIWYATNYGTLLKQKIGERNIDSTIDMKRNVGNAIAFNIVYIYDDKLAVCAWYDDGTKYGANKWFTINPDAEQDYQKVTPLVMSGKDSGFFDSLMRIYAATPDYFFIATNTTNYNALKADFALINRQDYFDSNPQFINVGVHDCW